jgi:hypothetical protein
VLLFWIGGTTGGAAARTPQLPLLGVGCYVVPLLTLVVTVLGPAIGR